MKIQHKQKKVWLVLLCMAAILLALGLFWFCHPHRYGEWTVLTEPDCQNPGIRARVCYCGKTDSEEIPRLKHDAVFLEARDPACTEEGHTVVFRCAACDTVLSGCTKIPALDHDYAGGVCTRCSALYPFETWPLPEPGEEIHGGAGKVVTPEEAQKAVFDTINPENFKGRIPLYDGYWQSTFEETVCMADITLLETVDCLWYTSPGVLRLPITVACCRVNSVYNACYGCTLKAGDEVTVALEASMYVPYYAVGPLKKDGRYLVALDDLSAPNSAGINSFRDHAQYMAVEDRWCQLEVVGEKVDNPRVDTAQMGLLYGLDAIPGCENYLEWGTQDVARFFAETKAAEEKRLGYEFEYYDTLWEDR